MSNFLISGFIVGMSTLESESNLSLTLQPCNTYTDEDEKTWAIAHEETKSASCKTARLLKLEKGKINFDFKDNPPNDNLKFITQTAILHRKKVQLQLEYKKEKYNIIGASWKEN